MDAVHLAHRVWSGVMGSGYEKCHCVLAVIEAVTPIRRTDYMYFIFCLLQVRQAANTKISQEALRGPRNAMCQSKFYQLLHNSVGTSCIKNPERIEVMELECYSQPTFDKLCASNHDEVDRHM